MAEAAELDPDEVLAAYRHGAFPMADPHSGEVEFFTCSPRFIVPVDERFRVPDSLAQTLRRGDFSFQIDTAFAEVVRACASVKRPDPRGAGMTWISPKIEKAYTALHRRGLAHSVEAWRDNRLVGGLYGVALGGAFFGESMFSLGDSGGRDASKSCLVHLVTRLRERGFSLLDSQYANQHLRQFGAYEIDEAEYLKRLHSALAAPVHFH